ncbi:MAG: dihydroorotase [Dehalococcoidales bacterium]|nr:dihydroorotase [Dehalococcoidales bacterium]
MKPLLIQGGRIIDPGQGIDETGSLLIREGKVSWLGKGDATPPRSGYEVLSAKGLTVCPGFIDLHCHLREPGFEDKETIASGSRAAAKGGFTTICAMPNTDPSPDNRTTVEHLKTIIAEDGVVRVLPIGCISQGRKGKKLAPLSELASAGVVAYSDDGDPLMDGYLMIEALRTAWQNGLPIIDHCEHAGLVGGGVINLGRISIELGLPGVPSAAEELMVTRDIALARLTGGWIHIAHVSTEESVNIIRRAKGEGIRVTAEVTPHHLTLTEEKVVGYDTNAKVNPPLRTARDVQALIQGLKDGAIDIIATDHAPHTQADKAGEFASTPSGISGFETALGSLLTLVHNGRLTLTDLISKLTSEPARILAGRHGNLGTLAVGAPADITLLDPNREWLVDTDAFVSKGRNTPLAGSRLKGKIMATLSHGNMVYSDDLVAIDEKGKK